MEKSSLGKIRHLLLILLAIGPAHGQESRPLAQIGFDSIVNDSEVATLLSKHSVEPKAAFVWSYGLNGTFRTNQENTASSFLQQVRRDTETHLKKAHADSIRQLEGFRSRHSQLEVEEDSKLQVELRALLNYERQCRGALATARSGQSMIYGLEVAGDQSALSLLRADEKVSVYFDAESRSLLVDRQQRMSLRPEVYNTEYRDPRILSLSSEDLYPEIESVATNFREGDNSE